jgi:hypothetical protein
MTLGFGGSAKTGKSKDEIQGSFASLEDDYARQATASANARARATAGPSTALLT